MSDTEVKSLSQQERHSEPDGDDITDIAVRFFLNSPHPIIVLDVDNHIIQANPPAEVFFDMSLASLRRISLADITTPTSPISSLLQLIRHRKAAIFEHKIDFSSAKSPGERIVDIQAAPLDVDANEIALILQERTMAEKFDRQLNYRGTIRSVSALASMLAHEIKNPLSGIRGAAQLLETDLCASDQDLTRLICLESDRILHLVNRIEMFGIGAPGELQSLNIHSALGIARQSAVAGFARHIRIVEHYDPSLPPILGNRDQLVQVFLNLLKNAAEAIGEDAIDGEITLSSAFRPGMKLHLTQSHLPISLALEICIKDNGPGISEPMQAIIFEPFVTSKVNGTGLGLAMVAKIIDEHGGIIECDSRPRRTTFTILLPILGKNERN